MQTFLPYSNFEKSSKCLDYRRLGKQRPEVKQILNAILYHTGWRNHPIVKMWTGYEEALKYYGNCVIHEWCERGYVNNMELFPVRNVVYPPWLGMEKFHSSHRAALLAKDFKWYSQFGWKEEPKIDYIWIRT